MIILGIEAATLQAGCAFGGQEGVLASFHVARGRYHAETLVPAIEFTCKQSRLKLSEVSVVAVDIGPGLFTGLRVGVATAKAIAMALRVPMIGLSSLDLLAFPLRWSSKLIVPVVDARGGEVYCAIYRHVSGGVQRLTDFQVSKPDDLAADLQAQKEDALLVGDGSLQYSHVFENIDNVEMGSIANAYPSAGALVESAHPKALREEFVYPSELHPLYLRKSDAEINWERMSNDS